jgi:NADH:ubiquinone oxidoreductase subunit C
MTSDTAKHEALIEAANSRFGDKITKIDRSFGDLVLIVDRGAVHDVLVFLKQDEDFDLLLDIVGIDGIKLKNQKERFEIEYIIYSIAKDHRVRVRVKVAEEDMNLPTASDVWQSANWAEREAFEMFGFNFVGHPCLKRLLTHHEFVGFPLRKDYLITKGQWCSRMSDLTEEMNE